MSKTRKHVSVTEGTYRRLKEYAERQGVSMSAVVETLLEQLPPTDAQPGRQR